MLGTLITGGIGLLGMNKANKMMSGVGQNQPSEGQLRGAFSGTQGLIDRMTNFGQYSGQAMDLASMQGNKGVEDAMMMGMGGSQANAIRNRLKRSSLTGVYDQYNKGLGQAAGLQQGIDSTISGQLESNRQYQDAIKMKQANAMMGLGKGMLGEDGLLGLSQSILGGIGIKK
jgi:hypothetical protein|tara:strand:- start:126 stop:641 length:516 start_codon:yes stop_codon:yes gene_type:complete